MEISESLRTLYTANVEEQDGNYYVEIPEREIDNGTLDAGETYRVAILPVTSPQGDSPTGTEPAEEEPESTSQPHFQSHHSGPPVEEGDNRDVEIANLGDQGDGIAKIDRGYVLIVPDTDVGEQVTVEIDQVRENVAFAEVVERTSRYN